MIAQQRECASQQVEQREHPSRRLVEQGTHLLAVTAPECERVEEFPGLISARRQAARRHG
jgi:hypothetical protein